MHRRCSRGSRVCKELLTIDYKIYRKIADKESNQHSMSLWKTNLIMIGNPLQAVKIKNGIFQGDSLSLTQFCLLLEPLSNVSDDTGAGYRMEKTSRISII